MNKLLLLFLATVVLSGCAGVPVTDTKRNSYPSMYSDQKPISMIIVPAINESTAANAGDLLNVTVTQPFANQGYYVMPVAIVSDIFKREGILEGTQIKGLPASMFKKNFGADSVLFLTITEWDKHYAVIAGNVSVGIEYVLLSTETNEVLWSYTQRVVVDTSGNANSGGGILGALIVTAISTAVTDYVPIAFKVHESAVKALPYGKYHPKSGADGDDKVVNLSAKENAVQAD
jgi:hypothetical protein